MNNNEALNNLRGNFYNVENMKVHEDIVENLFEQLAYLDTLPDFNESCTVLYIAEAIKTIKILREQIQDTENLNKDLLIRELNFQAAQQQSAGEIAELKQELQSEQKWASDYAAETLQLKADNERLREALKSALQWANEYYPSSFICRFINAALNSTPSESLQTIKDQTS